MINPLSIYYFGPIEQTVTYCETENVVIIASSENKAKDIFNGIYEDGFEEHKLISVTPIESLTDGLIICGDQNSE